MHLSLYIFGLEDLESREIEELLTAFPGVEDVGVRLSRENVRPGVIYASAEYVHYAIKLAEFVVGGISLGILNEAGKDIYLDSKQRIRQQLQTWTEERNAESHRERIHFTMTESGEMMLSMKNSRNYGGKSVND
jgi:hypothetical protein